MKITAFLTCVALVAGTIIATAGPISDDGKKAEQLLDQGDPVGAVEALDDAMGEVWKKSPLTFRKVLFVKDAQGYGVYSPRDSSVFKPGEPLVIYVEPIGFGYGDHAIGGYEIGLTADLALSDAKGNLLLSQEDFVSVAIPVRYHNREFEMKITATLTGLPAGAYVAKFHVRDQNSDKSGDFELPFEVSG